MALFSIGRTIFLMPRSRIPFNVPDDYDFIKPTKKSADPDLEIEKDLIEKRDSKCSFKCSILSLLFTLNVFYFAVLVIRWNYFISRSVSPPATTSPVTAFTLTINTIATKAVLSYLTFHF